MHAPRVSHYARDYHVIKRLSTLLRVDANHLISRIFLYEIFALIFHMWDYLFVFLSSQVTWRTHNHRIDID